MKYCETVGVAPFNWKSVLNKKIQDDDYEADPELLVKSASWMSCACGQLDERIPRIRSEWELIEDCHNRPMDATLHNLGVSFHSNIKDRNWGLALCRIDEIEKRESELLKELGF